VNLGDTYGTGSGAGLRDGKQATNRGTQSNLGWRTKGRPSVPGLEKSLLQIPARFAVQMTSSGWILRNEIIWHKPNTMPSPARDRFTVDFEKLFFFVKQRRYYFRQQLEPVNALMSCSPGRNRRCVWSIPVRPFCGAHFAVYPPALIEMPILAACPEGGVVLDPFIGSGTTAVRRRSTEATPSSHAFARRERIVISASFIPTTAESAHWRVTRDGTPEVRPRSTPNL
jgi:hypothetical protein